MYDYIKGALISKNSPKLVLECNSIGYEITCNQRTIALLPEIGENIKIYTKLIHKEDTMYLCGFLRAEERVIFDILTTVSGVGVKVAMILLDEFSGSELIDAVLSNDFKLISRAKGVGPKLAQKIILELKDKLSSAATALKLISSDIDVNYSKISQDTIIEVQTMLQTLGWTSNEYKKAIKTALLTIVDDDAEILLRECLKILSSSI